MKRVLEMLMHLFRQTEWEERHPGLYLCGFFLLLVGMVISSFVVLSSLYFIARGISLLLGLGVIGLGLRWMGFYSIIEDRFCL